MLKNKLEHQPKLSSQSETLQRANDSAVKQDPAQDANGATVPCPFRKHVIEVLIVGEDNKPLADQKIRLGNNEGKVMNSISNSQGTSRFEGLDEGTYQLSLYALDKEAWELIEEKPLEATSQGAGVWQTPQPAQNSKGFTHKIVQGECVAKIADKYGFFPDTIWSRSENTDLRERRKDMYILEPDDVVYVPETRVTNVSENTGTHVKVRRKGVPERLRIRFLKHDDTPRVGLPYLLSVKTNDDETLPHIKGTTDEKGFVDQPIPPRAVFAEIVLGEGRRQEVHEFDLGYVDPIDSVAGWQARLNILGYPCGEQDGEFGARTSASIKAFQRDKNLAQTGKMDDRTQNALKDMMLC